MSIKNLKPRADGPFMQGYFSPTRPEKYRGKVPIIFRSSWEHRFMVWCDTHPKIKCWANESFVIPYFNPCTKYSKEAGRFMGSWNNYNVDFFIQVDKGENGLESWIIEVKPESQVPTTEQIAKLAKKMNESKTPKKMNSLNLQLKTLLVNKAKFLAAKKFAEDRGCKFGIADENFLF